MDKSTVMKNYRFLALMLFAMVAGCVAGWFFPEFGHFIKPAGTVFINMMFCVVVPLVFASISNSVASVRSRKRAGKIMGTTVLTFVVTGAVAAVIMFIVMKLVPPGAGALDRHGHRGHRRARLPRRHDRELLHHR